MKLDTGLHVHYLRVLLDTSDFEKFLILHQINRLIELIIFYTELLYETFLFYLMANVVLRMLYLAQNIAKEGGNEVNIAT